MHERGDQKRIHPGKPWIHWEIWMNNETPMGEYCDEHATIKQSNLVIEIRADYIHAVVLKQARQIAEVLANVPDKTATVRSIPNMDGAAWRVEIKDADLWDVQETVQYLMTQVQGIVEDVDWEKFKAMLP